MSNSRLESVGLALGRLKLSVVFSCWVIGAALGTQVLIWALGTFTDIREPAAQVQSDTPMIVHTESAADRSIAAVEETFIAGGGQQQIAGTGPRGSTWDRILGTLATLTGGAGLLAALILVVLLAMGVFLATASATPGVDRTVSGFCWAVVAGLLILPLGPVVGLPWADGAIVRYEHMSGQIDLARGTQSAATVLAAGDAWGGSVIFYTRFLALPLACICGVALAGLRFAAGVELALMKKENLQLDPELEEEIAQIKPGSIYGSRAGRALDNAVKSVSDPATSPAFNSPPPSASLPGTVANDNLPRAREVHRGEAPRRVI